MVELHLVQPLLDTSNYRGGVYQEALGASQMVDLHLMTGELRPRCRFVSEQGGIR